MSNSSFQGLQRRRDFGVEKIKQKKYSDAREDFRFVVDNLVVDNDQKAALKMFCFNQIALCDIELGQYDGCRQACAECYNIFSLMRPDEKNKKTTHKNDILYQHYHTIICRLGQIEEKQKNYRQAIKLYQQAYNIYPNGEAAHLIQYCLVNFGIPPIDTEDKSLLPFTKIYDCIYTNGNFLNCYQECINQISDNMPDSDTIIRLDNAGIIQMLVGVTSYLLSEAGNETTDSVIDISLTLAALFIRKGAVKVWANSNVIIDIVNYFKDNIKLLTTCLSIVEYCPTEKYKLFANADFIHVWINALKLDFDEKQISEIIKFLFYVLNAEPKTVDFVVDTDIFEFALKNHTKEAFLLVRSLVLNDQMAKKARSNGTVDWTLSMMEENINTPTYLCMCLFVLTRILLTIPFNSEEDPKTDGFDMREFSSKCFLEICKVIKAQKDESVLIDAYAVLLQVLNGSQKEVKETKIILITSVLLASHMKNPDFEMRLLRFLYQCTLENLTQELVVVAPLLPTIMKVLDKYPNKQPIVEFAVSLAVSMNHPNKLSLLQSGLMQFPNSTILKGHLNLLKEVMDQQK